MKYFKNLLLLTSILALAFAISGCSQPSSSAAPAGRVAVTAQTVIDELAASMEAAGYTAERIDLIIAAAELAVSDDPDATLSSTDLYDVMPLITAGAVSGLDNPVFTGDAFKLMVLENILESLTGSLDGREVQSASWNARAIDPNADVMRAILAGITKAAIENLATAGVSDVNAAAGSVVGTLVDNMDGAGVTGGYVGEAAGDLVAAAVEVLGDNAAAVEIITGVAVETLATVDIDGFEAADIPEAVGAIAESVTSVLPDEDLIAAVTTGIANAAVSITADPVVMAKIVEETAAGATEGLGANADIAIEDGIGDVAQDTIFSFGDAGATVDGNLQTIVVIGASEGATNVDDVALADASAIDTALEANLGADSVDSADVDAGIAQADNNPPVIASIIDWSIEAGSTLNLGANATDEDGDTLSYSWAISTQPASDGVFESPTDVSGTSFKADTIGSYVIRVDVSDGINTVYTLVNVEVTAPTSMLARARLDHGISLITDVADLNDSAYEAALSQFSQVPEDTGDELMNIEKVYWHGRCHEGLENYDTAKSRYGTAIDMAQTAIDGGSDAAFEWKARATNSKAWITAWQDGDIDNALAMVSAIAGDAAAIAAADGGWVAEAYEFLQAFYINKEEWANAATAASTANSYPSASAKTKAWVAFHTAEAEWKQANYATAAGAFQSLGQAIIAGTPPYNELKVAEKYHILRWVYACAGWSANQGGLAVSTISGYYDEALAIAGKPDWWESYFEHERGWRYKQTSNETYYAQAEAAFLAGVAAGPNYSADMARRALGLLYCDWNGHEDEALPALENAYANATDPEGKLESGLALGEQLMWNWDNNDAAISQFNSVLNLDTSDYPVLEAKLILRLGHAWMRKGWDANDGVGTDHVGFFTTALGVLEQITLSAYPELNSGSDWIFYEAIGDRAEALVNLERGSEALTLIQSNIADAPSGNNKERLQFTIGKIHFEQGRQYRDDNQWQLAIDEFGYATTEFGKVIYEDKGYWQARALLDSADASMHEGWAYEDWYYDTDETVPGYLSASKTAFGEAITTSLLIDHTATYSDLVGDSDWIFYNAARQLIRAYSERNESGDLALAVAVADDIETFNIPGYNGGDEILEIREDLARAYRNVADDQRDEPWDVDIKADYDKAITEMKALIATSDSLGDPDGGTIAAWAYADLSRLYIDTLRHLWDSVRDDAMNDFPGVKTDYESYLAVAVTDISTGITFKSGSYPDDGRAAAQCQVTLAEIYGEQAWHVRDVSADLSDGTIYPSYATDFTDNLDDARLAYEEVLSGINDSTWVADEWVYSVALQDSAVMLSELIRASDVFSEDGGYSSAVTEADVEIYLNRMYALLLEAYAAGDSMERDRMAHMLKDFADAYREIGIYMYNVLPAPLTVDIQGQGTDTDGWSLLFEMGNTFMTQLVDNFTDVDDGRVSAEGVYHRGEMYVDWADLLHREILYTDAKDKYDAALVDLTRTGTGGDLVSILDDGGRTDDSDNIIDYIENTVFTSPPYDSM